jgi:hypothetical protein
VTPVSDPSLHAHLNERATGERQRDWITGWATRYFVGHSLRALVIDGDDCGLAESVAKWPFVERVDSVPEPDAFDVVIACHARGPAESRPLHEIEQAMKAEATLIVNDAVSLPMTGDLVDMITALKGSPPHGEQASGVLQSLFARFEVLEEKKLGGTLLRHLLDEPRPPVIVDMLCTFEAALVDAGAIPSEWNLLAARKRGASVRPISRPLPAIQKTLDPDPLRMRSRWRTHPTHLRRLEEWHLRLLRIILQSTTGSTRWFEEQEMHSAMERFRYAGANVTAFEWIISRYRSYGSDPAVLDLLATFDRLAPQ